MKHKVRELEGALLDAAVAKAEGIAGLVERQGRMCREKEWDPEGRRWDDDMKAWKLWEDYAPSQEWDDGGPIIERERIGVFPHAAGGWVAWPSKGAGTHESLQEGIGPTYLIAAMRAYIRAKLGEEVELSGNQATGGTLSA